MCQNGRQLKAWCWSWGSPTNPEFLRPAATATPTPSATFRRWRADSGRGWSAWSRTESGPSRRRCPGNQRTPWSLQKFKAISSTTRVRRNAEASKDLRAEQTNGAAVSKRLGEQKTREVDSHRVLGFFLLPLSHFVINQQSPNQVP